ncbi:MAG: hypothetical protein DRI44_04630 [Chlamydiae bacterium]|nr:MAG: hypothetical protein DRI44_04630 [Chlamydiota bacterium]
MTVATDVQARFNEFINDYGQDLTLRHFTGIAVADNETYNDIYDEVDISKVSGQSTELSYKDYTVRGHVQPIDLPQREQRLKHSTIGYYEQGRMRCFIKAIDENGTAIISRLNSANDFNLDLNDQILYDGTTFIVNNIKPWKIGNDIIYYELHLKIDIDDIE